MNVNETVYEYITSISTRESDIMSNILKLGLGAVLTDRLKGLDHKTYLLSCMCRNSQRRLNQVVQQELSTLSRVFGRAGIKPVYLKGLCLAKGLYEPPESRLFKDIDILIAPKDIKTALLILADMGYSMEDTDVLFSKDSFERLIVSETNHHFTLTKRLSDANLELELHYNLRSDMGLSINTDEVISRSSTLSLDGTYVFVPELHDLIIYLMVHFAFHYSRLLATIPFNRVHPAQEIRHLHDVALILEKQQHDIDWGRAIARAIEWNACTPVLCSLQLLERVYRFQISPTIVERLSDHINAEVSVPRRPPLHEIVKIDCNHIITSDIDNLINQIHPSLSANNVLVSCPYRSDQNHLKGDRTIVIDEYSPIIPNRFNTHIRGGEKPTSCSDCSARGGVSWDADGLHVYITVYDDSLVFGSPDDNPSQQDSVELLIYTNKPRPLKRHIVLSPYASSEQSLRIAPGTEDQNSSLVGLVGNCEIGRDQYSISLTIPWSALGLSPSVGMKLWLDVFVNDWDDKTQGRKSMMVWSGSRSFWLDLTAFGNVVLV